MDSPEVRLLLLPEQRSLLEYLGWALQHGGLFITVCNPEPSQTTLIDETLELTVDRELERATVNEPKPKRRTESNIAPMITSSR